ncbi:unnamed protein product [Parascedosporium putredinis]|uniref:Kinesin motor domain-containing protein n=1 Tax=Parascedosporium putredinis TaxID=1442378 RepID=A0A9P1H697_9PEZI|nr:unnamed protein product [Parascedosporium putredinis]CAI7997336.1 unnamed protein product [Parascedosporium putredinis]
MDQFYLQNAALYRKLVGALKPRAGPDPAQQTPTVGNPSMVVGARIRPLLDEDVAAGYPCAVFPRQRSSQQRHGSVVDIHDLYNHPRGRPILKSFNYEVDRLFDADASTEEIFDNLVTDLIPLAWDGGIGTLFAYGQTGSGKTFTVSRLEELVADALVSGHQNGERRLHITIIELAGNSAFDLLNSREPISIREDSSGTTHLSGANEHPVQYRKTS